MTVLNLIYAPDPIFKKKAVKIDDINDEIRSLAQDMLDTMQYEGAVGMGANMVGVLKRVIVIDFREENVEPRALINPEIISASDKLQKFEEASICFPHITAEITRPNMVEVKFQDLEGNEHIEIFEDFSATVIQHEIDYLDGKVFLDHLSRLKRDTLLKKMQKQMKLHPPHVHGAGCGH